MADPYLLTHPMKLLSSVIGELIKVVDPAKTTYMMRTGRIRQHNQMDPTKHIFGKSASAWLSSVNRATWVIDGLANEEMKPNSETPSRKP